MTGVGIRTPFIILIGIVLLLLLSFKNFCEALSGFVSEPLFWASGFASLELALLMILLKLKESTLTIMVANIGQILCFCYGVFVTATISLAFENTFLYKQALVICIIITLLMYVVDVAYSGRSEWLNGKFSQDKNDKANKIAQKTLVSVMFIFGLAYVLLVYFK